MVDELQATLDRLGRRTILTRLHLEAVVAVRCRSCLDKFGDATLLGEMIRHYGKWSWVHVGRRRDRLDRDERMHNRVRVRYGDRLSGGVQARCQRCSHAPRFTVAAMARAATEALPAEEAPGCKLATLYR